MRAVVLASLAAAACQSVGSNKPVVDVPALIAEPTPATTSELREAIVNALPGRRIQLADDALRNSSLLVVERRRHERIEGSIAAGVAEETPQRFRLVLADHYSTSGSTGQRTRATGSAVACELLHLNTGKRYPLPLTRCRAEPQDAD